VLDLAQAHRLAADKLAGKAASFAVNLGVGKGYSNNEVIAAVEKISGKKIRVNQADRRPGDPDAIYADNRKAGELLGWKPEYPDLYGIIVKSAWRWHSAHPEGYGD
jgi:UDP-glucose 4-epimerase